MFELKITHDFVYSIIKRIFFVLKIDGHLPHVSTQND